MRCIWPSPLRAAYRRHRPNPAHVATRWPVSRPRAELGSVARRRGVGSPGLAVLLGRRRQMVPRSPRTWAHGRLWGRSRPEVGSWLPADPRVATWVKIRSGSSELANAMTERNQSLTYKSTARAASRRLLLTHETRTMCRLRSMFAPVLVIVPKHRSAHHAPLLQYRCISVGGAGRIWSWLAKQQNADQCP